MSWKDYFFFTKKEKRGILVLLIIIVLFLFIKFSLPYWVKDDFQNKNQDELNAKIAQFDKMVAEQKIVDSIQRKYYYHFDKKEMLKVKLSTFDPNTADSAKFITLGLKPYVVSIILKYRNRGGYFNSVTDFSKIYGISPEKFKELEPYIAVHPKEKTIPKNFPTPKVEEKIIVELNTADTSALKKIKGIGSSFAKRIIRYRDMLGGFTHKEQLLEVYGITPEIYEKLSPFLTLNADLVKKIPVNEASVDRLKLHPYINFYQAKAIYEARQKKKSKKLNSFDEVSFSRDITDEFKKKINPYLNFD